MARVLSVVERVDLYMHKYTRGGGVEWSSRVESQSRVVERSSRVATNINTHRVLRVVVLGDDAVEQLAACQQLHDEVQHGRSVDDFIPASFLFEGHWSLGGYFIIGAPTARPCIGCVQLDGVWVVGFR